MKKKMNWKRRGTGALLAGAVAIAALPQTDALAAPASKQEPGAQEMTAASEHVLTQEEERPSVYRLVTKGGPSESGYQAAEWVDEDGNEAEGIFSYEKPASFRARAALPSSYSMADGELPEIRDQGQWGTCWAHAAIASVETNMVKKGLADASDVDYSERHLSYFSHRRNPALGDGDDAFSSEYGWYGGGNQYQAMATLANWYGAAPEEDYPYAPYGEMEDLTESDRTASASHLTDASLLTDASDVKRAVMENGAVMVSYYSGGGTIASAQEFVYHAEAGDMDHSVSIVGWDDAFDKSRFDDAGRKPEKNGAWKCRDSWGSGRGDGGYFWISYEDATLGGFCSFQAEGTDQYDKVYSYDGAMALAYIGYDESANLFRADEVEKLNAVSFYANKNYDYRIEIYAGVNGAMESPEDGLPVYAQEGSLPYPGYHVIPLENGVILDAGTDYAVAVKLISKDGQTASSCFETTAYGGNYSSEPGQSFFRTSKGWQATEALDASYKNVCIKAFTNRAGQAGEADLAEQIEAAERLKETDYTAASWAVLQEGLSEARQAASAGLSGSGLIRAILNLRAAVAGLVATDVYISDAAGLERFSDSVAQGADYAGQTVHLTRDLDMTGVTHRMIGSGARPFEGTFDGGGHAIANLTYEYAYSYGGLFGHVGENGAVRRVMLTDADFTFGHIYSGGIAGLNEGEISDCSVQGTLTAGAGAAYSGGIAGVNEGTIRNCQIQGEISLNADSGQIGGAVGENRGTAELVSVKGTVVFSGQQDPEYFVGGIAGLNRGSLLKCSMQGAVRSDSAASVGGIAGYSEKGSSVRLCRNLAPISGNPASGARTAGIGACLYGETYGCYNYGLISRAGSEKGAIYCYLGENSAYSNCYYLDASCGRGGYLPESSEGRAPEAEFASGKTAHDLNSKGGTDANAREWSQEDRYPVAADEENGAVIKLTVSQDPGNQYAAALGGVTDGAFYAKGGSLMEITPEGEMPEGLGLAIEASGLAAADRENWFVLPEDDAEVVIKSQAQAAKYKIRYHLNGGSGKTEDSYDGTENFVLQVPTKGSIEFLGWYDNEAFAGEPVSAIAAGSTGAREFWAKWNNTGYEVRFPELAGCRIVALEGSENGDIPEDGSYQFQILASEGYDVSGMTVKAGEEVLTASGGVYRIDHICSDLDVTLSGLKLSAGLYEMDLFSGYAGETVTIRPAWPATGIRLEEDAEFSGSVTADADREIRIATCDSQGVTSDLELAEFLRDVRAPQIHAVMAQPENGDPHAKRYLVTIAAEDVESGIGQYSFDGGETWTDQSSAFLDCGESPETYEGKNFCVKDRAGNLARYGSDVVIPAFQKYGASLALFAGKASYPLGEHVALTARLTFEDTGEEKPEHYGNVLFYNAHAGLAGTVPVTALTPTAGVARIFLPPSDYGDAGEKYFTAVYDGQGTPFGDSELAECCVEIKAEQEKPPIQDPSNQNPPQDAGGPKTDLPKTEEAQKFQKNAKANCKNGRYVVLNAKKKTAALVSVINKKATKLTVPDTVTICGKKCKVTEIKANACKGGKIRQLQLGKHVAKIGKNAFSNCKKLNLIRLKGKALKTVQKGAFSKTASKISVKGKKMTKKQKEKLRKALVSGGISKKVKI